MSYSAEFYYLRRTMTSDILEPLKAVYLLNQPLGRIKFSFGEKMRKNDSVFIA